MSSYLLLLVSLLVFLLVIGYVLQMCYRVSLLSVTASLFDLHIMFFSWWSVCVKDKCGGGILKFLQKWKSPPSPVLIKLVWPMWVLSLRGPWLGCCWRTAAGNTMKKLWCIFSLSVRESEHEYDPGLLSDLAVKFHAGEAAWSDDPDSLWDSFRSPVCTVDAF